MFCDVAANDDFGLSLYIDHPHENKWLCLQLSAAMGLPLNEVCIEHFEVYDSLGR
jgi:hypothetical protein